MEVTFLGSIREVGRAAVLVKSGNTRILLDYGVQLAEPEPLFPGHVAAKDVDAVVLTHAHLDHTGAAPLFMLNGGTRVYASEMTFQIADLLLRDFLKLSGYYLPFEVLEVQELIRRGVRVDYGETVRVKDVELTFLDAGHIPGSLQVLVNGDKTLLYTGDYSTIRTRLLRGAEPGPRDVDAIVTESTYALEDHPERRELEKKFVSSVRDVVEAGGVVLVPAFAVSRAQEIMCVLEAHGFRKSVAIDGMAVKVLDIFLENSKYVDGYELLHAASKHATRITDRRKRKRAVKRPGVIISPAGMLKGGPAVFYMGKIAEDERAAVFLVSFQIPGTPGARLLEEGRFAVGDIDVKVKARVEQFKFSAHAGRKELREYLKRLEPGRKVFVIHGESEACEDLAGYASEIGHEAIVPERGESYQV